MVVEPVNVVQVRRRPGWARRMRSASHSSHSMWSPIQVITSAAPSSGSASLSSAKRASYRAVRSRSSVASFARPPRSSATTSQRCAVKQPPHSPSQRWGYFTLERAEDGRPGVCPAWADLTLAVRALS